MVPVVYCANVALTAEYEVKFRSCEKQDHFTLSGQFSHESVTRLPAVHASVCAADFDGQEHSTALQFEVVAVLNSCSSSRQYLKRMQNNPDSDRFQRLRWLASSVANSTTTQASTWVPRMHIVTQVRNMRSSSMHAHNCIGINRQVGGFSFLRRAQCVNLYVEAVNEEQPGLQL
jgi:hypothetical protein